MQIAKDLDELWDQQAKALALLNEDPRRLLQARESANLAGKLLDIVKSKLVACELCNTEPEIPQLGKFKGKAIAHRQKLLNG